MPSKSEMSGFRRNAVIPDFHNGGSVRTDVDGSVVILGNKPENSAAQDLVEVPGMEGAQADELRWGNGGQG